MELFKGKNEEQIKTALIWWKWLSKDEKNVMMELYAPEEKPETDQEMKELVLKMYNEALSVSNSQNK